MKLIAILDGGARLHESGETLEVIDGHQEKTAKVVRRPGAKVAWGNRECATRVVLQVALKPL